MILTWLMTAAAIFAAEPGLQLATFRADVTPPIGDEPFVEFQLFAQQVAADSFVCVAGYGECGVWYYGPDSIFRDRGGYEQSWSLTGPCQTSVEAVLNQLLASPQTPLSQP
jgi:hypothetical protein